MKLIGALLAAAIVLQPLPVFATGRGRLMVHYTHQSWSEESDAPRPVTALAQDRRGYLWVATALGVFRFDGLRFELMSAGVDMVTHGAPSVLLVRRNGDVWMNFERSRRFAVYRDGQLRFVQAPPAPHRVSAMHESRDGTIWTLTERIGQPLLRLRNGKWTTYGAEAGAPPDNPFSMVVTSDGVVWISFSGSVAKLPPGARQLQFVRHDRAALGRLALDPDERVWLTDRHGSYPITGPGGRGDPPPLRYPYRTDTGEIRGWPAFDREGNLWVSTYRDGLERVARPDPRGAASPAEAVARVERLTTRDGLTSNIVAQPFQDAEGNVWVGTANGLDRFWPATLRFDPQLTDPAAFGDLLLQAADGTVYIGQASTVYRVAPGGDPEPIFSSRMEPRTLCEAPDGAIWIGTIDKNVAIWRDGRVQRLPQAAPLAYTIYDCAFDANGDYWVTASLGGMARYRNGRWEQMFGPPGSGFVPRSMVSDARGRLIVHWNDRTLSRLEASGRRSIGIPFGSYPPEDVTLHPVAPETLLVAGRFGFARLSGGRFQGVTAQVEPRFSGINGIIYTPGGESWLAGPAGVLRMRTVDLDRALSGERRLLPMQVFGPADGLRSAPHSHSRHSIVRGGDGRLWIAAQSGTIWLDPAEISRSRAAPTVAVGALTADRIYRDPTSVTLPAGTSDIQFDFAVFSFSNPRAARVRYRIEGQDSDWIEAGTRRQAFYTNLAPGQYRFRLIAANQDGVWNERGATVEFVIPPTFLQSRWFAALCILGILLLLWLAYRLRMARVAATIRSRLEERLGERERIARELHDTLLQSVQGLVLRFQSVANRMPAGAASRAQLEAALARADEVIAEGRDRVQDLRVAEGSSDLPMLLGERAAEAGFDADIPVRIVVEGRPRPVHPLISVELGRIADEVFFNIARHAAAKSVEITIRFAARELGVEMRDDGVGIDAELVAHGHKPGHFGIVGMRERAERIGGTLSLDSWPGGGTAVTVTLPGRLAFADHRPRRRLFPWLRRGSKDTGHD